MFSTVRLTAVTLILLPLYAATAGVDDPPAAAWVFNGSVRQTVPDVSGHRHHALEQAPWRPEGHEYRRGAREFDARYSGRLDFGGGDAIGCRLTLSAAAGSPVLVATAELEARGWMEYYYLMGDERLRRALVRVADHAMSGPDPGNFRKAVIFAARHADDPTPYRRYLDAWARGADIVTQVVPHNPLVYGGPRGMLRGSVSGSLFAMNDEAYLLSALEGDPPFGERQWQAIRKVDQVGGPFTRPPELNWQSDYDRPELGEYLRIKHPQP